MRTLRVVDITLDPMSCVLRITSDNLGARLHDLSLRPYRFESDTAHFLASERGFNNLAGQVEEAISFLRSSNAEIAALLAAPNASGVLDFAVESADFEFRYALLPSELVREAAELGLALEVSLYPRERGGDDVA